MVPSGSQHFDTIVISAGPGGEPCAGDLATAGQKVPIVESERVGGECAFWASMPTKVLLQINRGAIACERVARIDLCVSDIF